MGSFSTCVSTPIFWQQNQQGNSLWREGGIYETPNYPTPILDKQSLRYIDHWNRVYPHRCHWLFYTPDRAMGNMMGFDIDFVHNCVHLLTGIVALAVFLLAGHASSIESSASYTF